MKKLVPTSILAALFLCLPAQASGGGHGGGCGPGGGGGGSLVCDAGGPYKVAVALPAVTVQLDGSGSLGATGYAWSTNFPGATFDNPNVARPFLTIPVGNDCTFSLTVRLTVSNGSKQRTCSAAVRVEDRVKPVITCPPLAKVFCGDDTSPAALGFATATDNCDTNVKVKYKDRIIPGTCPAERFDHVIERTWTAIDDDCNFAKCVQIIDVVKVLTKLDAFPGQCPNVYDRDGCGLVPVAILGLEGFNVNQIQWHTVKLYGKNCNGGPVPAQCFAFADVATPFFNGADCECHDAGPDGRNDLVAFFKRSKLNHRLNLDCVDPGTQVPIVVTGRLSNGCRFIAEDCLLVQ